MEYEKIEQLIDHVGNSKLTSIDINFPDGTRISMKKDPKQENVVVSQEVKKDVSTETKVVELQDRQDVANVVKSPMVGTFYTKSSPTSEPYVEIGKTVKKGDILCIIEAMKLMNEIESEFSGEIVEILVKNGDTVEYGTPLFRIK